MLAQKEVVAFTSSNGGLMRFLIVICGSVSYLILMSTFCVRGQNTLESACKRSFEIAEAVIVPATKYRADVFSNSCDYQAADKRGISLLISLELFADEELASEGFKREAYDSAYKLRRKEQLSSSAQRFWDNCVFYVSKREHDTFLTLQKGRLLIFVSSDDLQFLKKVEGRLRESWRSQALANL